jgi:endonuclease/exonuclease/phosphatase family metal-dependent hydrolase
MRIATFNLESLDLPPRAVTPIEVRADALRPALERLRADILCLQEINGQRVPGKRKRELLALDRVLEGTRYAGYHRVATSGVFAQGGVADVDNLVVLSRYPIRAHREILHGLVDPLLRRTITSVPIAAEAVAVRFDRPLLSTDIDLPGGQLLTVINLHLRAPLASNVTGQKLDPFVWKTVGGWAEGYFLSAMRRAGQALELRLVLEQMFDAEPRALIALAGDFNAEDHEVPLKIIAGAEEDTGNAELSSRSLVLLERALPADRRWSVLHHGRPQMLDHILVSRALHARFARIEVHNEILSDELVGYARHARSSGSSHAGIVAEFALPHRAN